MDPVESYAEDCACDGDFNWVVRTIANGAKQYGQQCLRCGRMQVMRRTKIPVNVRLEEYDEQIRDYYHERCRRFYERRMQQADAEREAKQRAWWERYNEYLDSDQWREKRQRVLERDKHTCQACYRRRATQVHHLTYDHVFSEPLFDLVSICSVCHEALTILDRNR